VTKIGTGSAQGLNTVAFSPNGRHYVRAEQAAGLYGNGSRKVEVRLSLNGAKVISATNSGSVDSLALSNNGYLAILNGGTKIEVWKYQ
jgi:hypothetical protein